MSVNMQVDKTEQNKFSRLLLDTKTSQDAPKIDVPDLIALLQCFGFVLHNFEKTQESTNSTDNGDNSINMEITCASSGMKATLIKTVLGCKCPSNDATSKAELWNISGCGPSNQGNISRSMSSLVPTVTPGQTKFISFLLVKAFNAINFSDQNNSYVTEILKAGNLSGLSRHRSLDTIKTADDSNTACLPPWDAMPLVPSPKQTSSPIPDLCSSLKQISLGSQTAAKLTDILKEMAKLISESLEITTKCQNATFVKPGDLETRRLSDIKISPLALEGENKPVTGNFNNVSKVKTPNSSGRKKTPQKRLIRKVCCSTGEMKCFVPPSKLVPLKGKRHLSGTPTTSKNIFDKVDTPRPDVTGKPNASGFLKPKPLNLSDVKPKVTTRIDSKLASKLRIPQKVVISSAATKN